MRRLWIALFMLIIAIGVIQAQDGINLNSELYVLLNAGTVERYGIGAAGVQTVTPEDEFVLDFGIAPDGNWIAYRTQQGLFLANMYDLEAGSNPLDTHADVPPLRGRGDTIAWSPSGDVIAYTTQTGLRAYFAGDLFTNVENIAMLNLIWSPEGTYLAAESEENIWWIYRRDGTQLILTSAISSSLGIDWLTNTQLIFAPADGGLLVMDLAAGNQQTPLLDNTWQCALPFVEPDSSISTFCRRNFDTTTDEGTGRLIRVTFNQSRVNTEDLGTAPLEFAGKKWAKGGGLVLGFQGGTLALIEPRSAQGFTLPISSAVAYGWGPFPPQMTATLLLSNDGYVLAPDTVGIMQVWRIPRTGELPLTITPSESDVTAYAVSPDGRNVAYVSDDTLWLHTPNTNTEPRILAEEVGLLETGSNDAQMVFGPDGQRIAYSTARGIRLATINQNDNEVILPNGDDYQFMNPQFAPNINALLAFRTTPNGGALTVMDLNTGQLIESPYLATRNFDGGFWMTDGRLVTYGAGFGLSPVEIFVVDINAQDELVPLFTVPPGFRVEGIAQTGNNVLRIITAPDRLGPVMFTIIQLPIGGQAERLEDIEFMANPQFAPSGNLIAGYAHKDGPLVVHVIDEGERVQLSNPMEVRNFHWR